MKRIQPVLSANEEIRRAFIHAGLKWKPTTKAGYEGRLTGNAEHQFKIRVTNIDPTFLDIPTVHLREWPADLNSAPHILDDGSLCYLDRDTITLDPYSPYHNTRIIIEAISSVLRGLLDPDIVTEDFSDEISAYWKSEGRLFLTSDASVSSNASYKKNMLDGKEIQEYVTFDKDTDLTKWAETRGGEDISNEFGQTITVNMNNICTRRSSGQWPPTTWKAFIEWLEEDYQEVAANVIHRIRQQLQKKHTSIIVILTSEKGGSIGVGVVFQRYAKDAASRQNGPQKTFRDMLVSQQSTRSFQRLSITDVREQTIIERNLRTPSLKNKKIAVIGAGTVGSETAVLLVKAGAGTGSGGQLDIFDGYTLKPGNLGRHILNAKFINEQKGKAVAEYLQATASYHMAVTGYDHLTAKNIEQLKHYDLIVDATGNETFSILLSGEIQRRRREKNTTSVILIHTWIDAYGYAVRALLDDGKFGCIRCLKTFDAHTEEMSERFELFNKTPDIEMRRQKCGESYIPFAAGASNIAAGMTQQMALNAFNGIASPRFRHYSLSDSVKGTKEKNVDKAPSCPCCTTMI